MLSRVACRSRLGGIRNFASKRPPPPIAPRSCTMTKPPTQRISTTSAPAMASVRGRGTGSSALPTSRPTKSSRTCETTPVVLSTTTEASPSRSGTSGRSRYAFTGSPPTEAVGVPRFTASPARRTARRRRNERGGLRKVKRHPRVSTSTARHVGKTRITRRRHDRARNAFQIAAGPTWITRYADDDEARGHEERAERGQLDGAGRGPAGGRTTRQSAGRSARQSDEAGLAASGSIPKCSQ